MAYQLSAKDRELLISKQLQERIVGDGDRPYENGKYGTQPTDFLLFQLYDTSNNLIESKNLPPAESHTDLSLGIYPAKHIKESGYDSGTFKVRYQFLRKLAGNDSAVLLRSNSENEGVIYDNLDNIYITNSGKIFLGTREQFEQNDGNLERLILEEYKYQIDEISATRTEVRLKAKNIKGAYKEEFSALQESIRNSEVLTTTTFIGTDGVLDNNENLNVVKGISIATTNFQFTPNMVDSIITIPDVYKIDEQTIAKRSEVNIIANSSGELLRTNDQGNIMVGSEVNSGWDTGLHYMAVWPIGWAPGFYSYANALGSDGSTNHFHGTGDIGYHAHWVREEGFNGGTCIKFPDINEQFTAEDNWPTDLPNRMLRMDTDLLPNLLGQGISENDKINISFMMKSTVAGRGVRVAARFPQHQPIEPQPAYPLILNYYPGYDTGVINETMPEFPPDSFIANIPQRAIEYEVMPPTDTREYETPDGWAPPVVSFGDRSDEVAAVDTDGYGGTGHWRVADIEWHFADAENDSPWQTITWFANLHDDFFNGMFNAVGIPSPNAEWVWNGSVWASPVDSDPLATELAPFRTIPTTDIPPTPPANFVPSNGTGAESIVLKPNVSSYQGLIDLGVDADAIAVDATSAILGDPPVWKIYENSVENGILWEPNFTLLSSVEYSKQGTVSDNFEWQWSGTDWQPSYIAPSYASWYNTTFPLGMLDFGEPDIYLPVINPVTGENVDTQLQDANYGYVDSETGEFRSDEDRWIWAPTWDGSAWSSNWIESDNIVDYEYKIGANGMSADVPSTAVGEWQKHEVSFTVPAQWRKDIGWNIVFYGHTVTGNTQGVSWVDDIFCDFTYTTQATIKDVLEPFKSKITEVNSPTAIKVEKSFEDVRTEIYGDGSTNAHMTINNPGNFSKFSISYTVNNPYDLRTYLKSGNDLFLTTNFKRDTINVGEWPHSIIYKLYQPLPDKYAKFDEFTIVKEMADPYEDNIKIVDFVDTNISNIVLRSPDLFSQNGVVNRKSTAYKTETEILTEDLTISEKMKNEFISQSFQSVELNTDYSRYENFVNFSSIEKRIWNFKYKLELIESYTESSASLLGISGSSNDLKSWKGKVSNLKNNFDPFEKYMYFKSSSYSSGSLGTFYDNAWPKTAGSGSFREPYISAHTTSSVAESWFSIAMTSASNYDTENSNKLSYQLPEFIKDDSQNEIYLRFTDMIGQHFDSIWEYINSFSDTYDRREKLDEGISKELLYTMAKSLGWEIPNSKDLIGLSKFAYGVELTGSLYSETSAISERDVSRELWSRIINNMPFFLKNKGTVRALKGLINIYGIPSTILRVKEYGGPDLPDSAVPQFEITRKFTKALDFRSNQYIKTTWSEDSSTSRKPDTVEFRFRAATGSNQILAQKVNSNDHNWFIRLKDNGSSDDYGTVSFMLSSSAVGIDQGQYKELSSSALPVYDGDFYSVMVGRTSGSDNPNVSQSYSLSVGKYDSGRSKIHLYSETTMDVSQAPSSSFNLAWTGSGDVYIGGKEAVSDVGAQFSGSIMEYRHWTETLNTPSFKNHIGNPKAYDGNSISSSYNNLVLRYSFDDDKELDVEGVRDVSANQTTTYSGSHSGFTGNFFRNVVDELKSFIPSIGALRRSTNKIRIEDDNVLPDHFLSATERATQGAYDTAPLDSNRVGIYFAPTDVINTDIINSVANLRFDDYLGDPRDLNEYNYRGLDYVADNYWKKYNSPNNFWDYIRIIKYYDQSMFPQLKKMIPARAKARIGVLIEPNIFERPKVIIGRPPSAADLYYSSSIDIGRTVDSLIVITGSFNAGSPITNYEAYTSRIDMYSYETGSSIISSSGESLTYEGSSSEIRDRCVQGSMWLRLNNNDAFYSSSTITFGDTRYAETLQPVISGSRIYGRNQKLRKFFSSAVSHSNDNYHSSSWINVDLDNQPKQSTARFNLFYAGVKNTQKTTIDGGSPFEYIITAPTKLVTQESGDSTLKTGEGKVSQFKLAGGKQTYLQKKNEAARKEAHVVEKKKKRRKAAVKKGKPGGNSAQPQQQQGGKSSQQQQQGGKSSQQQQGGNYSQQQQGGESESDNSNK